MLLPNGQIIALSAERVGRRRKHDLDSRIAYTFLRERYAASDGITFGGEGDHFYDTAADQRLVTKDHHLFHAWGSFVASGFDSSAILVVDGQGPQDEKCMSTSIWFADSCGCRLVDDLGATDGAFNQNSLGHFYTAIAALCGFDLNCEGKLMGLAGYGRESVYVDFLRRYFAISDHGYQIDACLLRAVFDRTFGPKHYGWKGEASTTASWWDDFLLLHRGPICATSMQSVDREGNLAFAGQLLLEEAMTALARGAKHKTGCPRLCLAGGVALNCSANSRIARAFPNDPIFVVPAAGDDGQALGKIAWQMHTLGLSRPPLPIPFLGPEYTSGEVEEAVRKGASKFKVRLNLSREDLLIGASELLASGSIIAWFHGRSEFGPRALGHRSILADPGKQETRVRINSIVKEREWYRPLAPAVTKEAARTYFEMPCYSPYMLFTGIVRSGFRNRLAAVTHVDGSARVQTVERSFDDLFYDLLEAYGDRTGIPILLNTSFNSRDEPLVETPDDAIAAFEKMDLDALYVENHLLLK